MSIRDGLQEIGGPLDLHQPRQRITWRIRTKILRNSKGPRVRRRPRVLRGRRYATACQQLFAVPQGRRDTYTALLTIKIIIVRLTSMSAFKIVIGEVANEFIIPLGTYSACTAVTVNVHVAWPWWPVSFPNRGVALARLRNQPPTPTRPHVHRWLTAYLPVQGFTCHVRLATSCRLSRGRYT